MKKEEYNNDDGYTTSKLEQLLIVTNSNYTNLYDLP